MGRSLAGLVVIFDLDGTLIDTAADLAAAMNHVLSQNQREPIPVADVRHLVGSGAKAMIRRGFGLSPDDVIEASLMDRYVDHFLDHYLSNIAEHSRPFPGVIEAMGALAHEGARFAICTNKREAPAKLLIGSLGLDPFFEAIIGADTTFAAKPNPAMVSFCLEKTGARSAIFVGDSDTDIKTAQAANLPCLFHNSGYGPATLSGNCRYVFDDYERFADLVRTAAQL
ncbi:MAG: HAD-IA family hydrolase [Pseudomonadota bacterium]